MVQNAISATVKVRVLQEVRKHMSLTDEEFRQLAINILREHMEDHSSFSAGWIVEERLDSSPIQVSTMVDDDMRHRVVDDFIAAARRLLLNGAEGSSFAEEPRKAL
jgi:hypothetical protein